MSEPTRTIWLNYGCDCPEWPKCLCVNDCDEDITWSVQPAVDHAIEFVPMSDYATLQQEVERLLKMALEQNGQLDETVERMDEHRKGIEDENAALRERWARFNE